MNGTHQGLPGGGKISQGVVGTITENLLTKALSNAGKASARVAVGRIGYAKLAWDFGTFAYTLGTCGP